MAEFIELELLLTGGNVTDQDMILALLADFGFEGFREEEGRILAYIRSGAYEPEKFKSFLERKELSERIRSITQRTLPHTNWNALWEKDYPPVVIAGTCQVRAPFHAPRRDLDYDLVISPKMSFGTAHHETTQLMIECILERDWSGRKVLDFGCGTGVLAILAEKLGARDIVAMDNDQLACENSRENVELNACTRIRIIQSEPGMLEEDSFHAILGNVNLNVLTAEMENLSHRMLKEGIAILSGFYRSDLGTMNRSAAGCGLQAIDERSLNQWTVAVYRKAD